jgi:hypothetical protein
MSAPQARAHVATAAHCSSASQASSSAQQLADMHASHPSSAGNPAASIGQLVSPPADDALVDALVVPPPAPEVVSDPPSSPHAKNASEPHMTKLSPVAIFQAERMLATFYGRAPSARL